MVLMRNEEQILHKSFQVCMTSPNMQSCSMAAQETGSVLQMESDKVVYAYQTFFDIFLERIMCEGLGDHEGSVSIGGFPLCI